MNLLTFFFFTALYYAIKRLLETMVADESPRPVDNSIITCDVVNGITLAERKQ